MESEHILNGNQNNKRVELTVDRQETEKNMMQLGKSLQEAQRPVRSLITPPEGTPQWFTVGNWNIHTLYTMGYCSNSCTVVAKEMSQYKINILGIGLGPVWTKI